MAGIGLLLAVWGAWDYATATATADGWPCPHEPNCRVLPNRPADALWVVGGVVLLLGAGVLEVRRRRAPSR